MSGPLLEIRDLRTWFPVRGGVLLSARGQCKAVDGVSLSVWPGETVGLVGESGCGKSTLGKSVVRLVKPTGGQVLFEGTDLASLPKRQLKPFRREVQMIFQDPADSLNSRLTVGSMLEEPFLIHGIGDEASRREKALELAPDSSDAHAARGFVLFQQKEVDAAEESFNRAMQLDPLQFESRYFLGRIRFQQGRHEEAAKLFDEALEAREDYQAAFFGAQAREALGSTADTDDYYRTALEVRLRRLDLATASRRARIRLDVALGEEVIP